jgi:two-component system KDP operon response regulator KdpE
VNTAHRAASILLIEDQAQIRKFLRISLEAHGFEVSEARLAQDGLTLAARRKPDLVILDLGLPDMDGHQVITRLREWSSVPIIVLSVRSGEQEKVEALDRGANDYVTKPFGISELMARIRAMLRGRRDLQPEASGFRVGELEIDFAIRRVRLAGRELRLSRKEYDLLRLFATHPGQVLTHEHILNVIWGSNHIRDNHYLRVLVGHLRQKLGELPSAPRYIITEQGVGYRLMGEEAAPSLEAGTFTTTSDHRNVDKSEKGR